MHTYLGDTVSAREKHHGKCVSDVGAVEVVAGGDVAPYPVHVIIGIAYLVPLLRLLVVHWFGRQREYYQTNRGN